MVLRVKYLSLSFMMLFLLLSCGGNGSTNQGVTENELPDNKEKDEAKDLFRVGDICFETENLSRTTFLNGDEIPQAQSAEEWQEAGKNESPAWCYSKTTGPNGEKQILYNYYALMDERGLVEPMCKITPQTVEELQECLNYGACQFIPQESTAERNYLGKFYDLELVNWWIADSIGSVACWSEKGDHLLVHKVSKSNGFFVRCLKN